MGTCKIDLKVEKLDLSKHNCHIALLNDYLTIWEYFGQLPGLYYLATKKMQYIITII